MSQHLLRWNWKSDSRANLMNSGSPSRTALYNETEFTTHSLSLRCRRRPHILDRPASTRMPSSWRNRLRARRVWKEKSITLRVGRSSSLHQTPWYSDTRRNLRTYKRSIRVKEKASCSRGKRSLMWSRCDTSMFGTRWLADSRKSWTIWRNTRRWRRCR